MTRRGIVWRLLRSGLVALARFGAALSAKAVIADEDERVPFRCLADEAERLAALLQAGHGVCARQPVGILGVNSVGLVRCLLAVSRLGAKAVLLNPYLPAEQLARLLEAHALTIVLSPDRGEPPGGGAVLLDPAELLHRPDRLQPPAPVRAGEIVVLTGGTTGLPKPAARPAGPWGVVRLFAHLIAVLRLERRRAILVAVPLFHGFGLAALLTALAFGRTVHLRRRFDSAACSDLIAEEGIDTLAVVPTMLQRLLVASDAPLPLRCIVSGGAPLPAPLAQVAMDRWGSILFNLYGTSEAGLSTIATPDDLRAAPGTIGRPMWGVAAEVRDAAGLPCQAGASGDLLIRNRAAITPGWLRTGDRAMRDARRRLFLLGRADDMIVSGGENVCPWDVESVLRLHPDVADVAAVGVADDDFGQRLIAFVAAKSEATVDAAALTSWLAPRVARHQMPRALLVCDALPLTPLGKVDRRRLAAEADR